MRLAYSSNAYTRTDLSTALGSIANLGYAGAEILCDHPHWIPGRVRSEHVAEVAALLTDKQLAISNLNANTANCYFDPLPAENLFEPSLSSNNPEYRRWRVRYSIDALHLAAAVGAPCISITSGRPASGGTPQQGLELLVDSLGRICEVARQLGVRVGIEYEPGLLVERAEEVAEVIRRVDSPLLGVNLDIGHSYLAGETPEQVVALLGGRIWNVHVEDIADHKHFHLIPGEGELPLQRYFTALERNGYQGYLTVELYTYPQMPDEAGRRSRNYLLQLFGQRL